jgi:hypothetical protein
MKVVTPRYLNAGIVLLVGPVITGVFAVFAGVSTMLVVLTAVLFVVSLLLIALAFVDTDAGRLKVFYPDGVADTEMIRLIRVQRVATVQLLSAALGSRRELIEDCLLKEKVAVQLLVQDDDVSISRAQVDELHKSLTDIVDEVARVDPSALRRFTIHTYRDRASVRGAILRDSRDSAVSAFLGWYVYRADNTHISGSPHPSISLTFKDQELMSFVEQEFKSKWETGTDLDPEQFRSSARAPTRATPSSLGSPVGGSPA